MESGHGDVAVLLIEAGADRTRVLLMSYSFDDKQMLILLLSGRQTKKAWNLNKWKAYKASNRKD